MPRSHTNNQPISYFQESTDTQKSGCWLSTGTGINDWEKITRGYIRDIKANQNGEIILRNIRIDEGGTSS